jgi:hypothetical protein
MKLKQWEGASREELTTIYIDCHYWLLPLFATEPDVTMNLLYCGSFGQP